MNGIRNFEPLSQQQDPLGTSLDVFKREKKYFFRASSNDFVLCLLRVCSTEPRRGLKVVSFDSS